MKGLYCLQSSNDGNSTISVLNLVPRMEDLGGQLACRASNPLIEQSTIQDKINLKIDCEYRISSGFPCELFKTNDSLGTLI